MPSGSPEPEEQMGFAHARDGESPLLLSSLIHSLTHSYTLSERGRRALLLNIVAVIA